MTTKPPDPTRLRCCVPFCGRTRAPQDRFAEWVCPQHWTAVDKRLRRLHAGCKRAGNKAFWRKGWADVVADPRLARMAAREIRVWARCKRQAIERAAGI